MTTTPKNRILEYNGYPLLEQFEEDYQQEEFNWDSVNEEDEEEDE